MAAAAAAPPPALEGACRALLGAYAAAARASGGAAASLSDCLQKLAALISGGFPSRWALAGPQPPLKLKALDTKRSNFLAVACVRCDCFSY